MYVTEIFNTSLIQSPLEKVKSIIMEFFFNNFRASKPNFEFVQDFWK